MGNIIIHGLNKCLQHTVVSLLFSLKETQVTCFFFLLKYTWFLLHVQDADWQKPNLGIGWEIPRPVVGSGTHHFSRSIIYSEENLQKWAGGDPDQQVNDGSHTPQTFKNFTREMAFTLQSHVAWCRSRNCNPRHTITCNPANYTKVLTAPKITPMTWACTPEILNWAFHPSLMETASFIRHWC